jgi:uncharacterized protein (TIGR00297 family)
LGLESGDGIEVLAGFAAAAVIAGLGFRKGSLAGSGAVAAAIVGGLIVTGGSWSWGLLMVLFFVSSSVLSTRRVHRRGQDRLAARGNRRDAVQVVANGGVATVLAVAAAWVSHDALAASFAGALAAAAGDTWSTEVGALSRRPPRLITTGQAVIAGTSGGVTALGLVGAVAGSLVIATAAAGLSNPGWFSSAQPGTLLVAVAMAGTAGSVVDSLMGATIQARFRCPACELMTERRTHRCGTLTIQTGGWRWITNDTVNFLTTAAGAIVAALVVTLLC